jgi:hypothetical protein
VRTVARLLGGCGLLVALFLAPSPAYALCAGIPSADASLRDGGMAFVGTAVSVTNAKWATFHVEEVWSAHELPEWLEVSGGVGEPALLMIFESVGSTDRSFQEGVRYLVFPMVGDHGGLRDTICSGTTPWHDELAAARPGAAHPSVPAARPVNLVPIAIVAVTAGLGLSIAALRRPIAPVPDVAG